MRVFVAVRHSIDPTYYYGGLWSANFYPALLQLGHELIESQVDLLPASRFMHIASEFTPEETEIRAKITQNIIEEVKRANENKPIDLFLSYFYNAHFDPSGFDLIRRLGIPTVNFYCNSIYQFEFVTGIASAVDFSWHAERDARRLYLDVKATPIWVQMGADPNIYYPLVVETRLPRACFVGQRYADRDRWMAHLVNHKVPVDIYGPGWDQKANGHSASTTSSSASYLGRKPRSPGSPRSYVEASVSNLKRQGVVNGVIRTWHQYQYRNQTARMAALFKPLAKGSIPFERIREVFAEYEVILNFSNVWSDGRPGSALIPHVRLRDFEAPMCRTCYLTGHTDEIAEFYEIGKEIETYKNPEELIDKVCYYLRHPTNAEALRDAGYRRATRDHSWKSRFEQLFRLTGLAR